MDIPEALVERLDLRAKSVGVSRAALVRQAIDAFLGPADVLSVDQVFGLWGDHAVDGLAYQKAIRAEWDREWDPD